MRFPTPLQRLADRVWRRAVAASATALFPRSDEHPDHVDTDLVPRTIAYVEGLPPSQRPLVKFMFFAVEWGSVVLSPGLPFSWRSPARRLAMVDRWRESWLLPHRLLGDALRATLVMVYYSHPAAQAAFGEPPEGRPMKEAG